MRLHFQVQGRGHPLVILHGFLGSLDNWRAMSKRLAGAFRIYAVDLRNHGRSPHSDVMNYPVMAQDAVERPLAKPACFIRGGRSNFVDDRDLASLHAAFPRAEIKTIAGAGHWLHVEAADEFYIAMSNFLAPANR